MSLGLDETLVSRLFYLHGPTGEELETKRTRRARISLLFNKYSDDGVHLPLLFQQLTEEERLLLINAVAAPLPVTRPLVPHLMNALGHVALSLITSMTRNVKFLSRMVRELGGGGSALGIYEELVADSAKTFAQPHRTRGPRRHVFAGVGYYISGPFAAEIEFARELAPGVYPFDDE